MMTRKTQIAAGMLALLGLFALSAQLPITIDGFTSHGGSALGGVWRFFGYFTITTNILCMLVMVLAALNQLKNPNWLSAITTYMAVLCLVYWLLLSKNNHQVGWNFFVDTLLHYVLPLGTFVAWVVAFPKQNLTWIGPIKWMAYPISYSVYVMARGAVEGWYPYFFLDAGTYGYPQVALNTLGLALLFLVAGLMLVAGARFIGLVTAPKVLQAP
jgi:hypothetical protein